MTDNDIIKALDLCRKCIYGSCPECPLHEVPGCDTELMVHALDLINRQKVEIESLKSAIESLVNESDDECDYE